MELDQMEAPAYRQGPNYDGFDPAKEYAGLTQNPDGSPIEGLWATYQIYDEPMDFDMAFQPPKPDISLLTSAMLAACVEVKEVPQGADGTANSTWIVNDSASTNPGQWDNTTDFVHNLQDSATAVINTRDKCRDVNALSATFWVLHAVGAYELNVHLDGDATGERYTFGGAANGFAFFLIFNEAIRDDIHHGNGIVPRNKRNEMEMRELVAFHESLHLFGFADGNADGPIMNVETWTTTDMLSVEVTTLSPTQIKKIQTCDYPH